MRTKEARWIMKGTLLLLAVTLSVVAYARPSITQVDLDSDPRWEVEYQGRVYDPSADQTTFAYLISVNDDPALSHYTLGLPLCDTEIPIATYSPEGASIGLDPTTGVYGIKWDLGLDPGLTRTYSITFMGNVAEGNIEVAVKAGLYAAIGERPGASCETVAPPSTYDISGALFIDANVNGTLDPGEPLLANTTVALYDADGNLIATTVTDVSGNYIFSGLPNGNYVVDVPSATDVEDFNEVLNMYFNPATPVSVDITIAGANLVDNNFGFVPDVSGIQDDLNSGDPDGNGFSFVGTGKTIGFWKHQLTVALTGKGRAQVTAATVKTYLAQIEALFLVQPFQFAGSLSAALSVLQSTSSKPLDLLLKQLLATEFNHVAGWGLSGQHAQLQAVLVAWGEFLAAHSTSFSSEQLLDAKDLFDLINNTGE